MHAMTSPCMVFMYREEPHRASRWLVDQDGRAVGRVVFDRPCLTAARDLHAGAVRRT